MKGFLIVLIGLLIFLVGIITGTALGMQAGQRMLFEGLAVALSGSNIDVDIDLNETQLIEGFKETFIPLFNETLKKQVNEE